ncbi:MAG: hypothetical protein HYZ34_07810 [Ignavibacteriae bacterium]|nr:hypothetical protein [Ignavibacteriota bacterium]
MPRGFEPKPSGLYSAIFAVRPLDKKRVNMSDMIINDVHDDRIVCGFMGHTIELPKDALQLGIKTASYFRRFEITPKYGDWVLKKRCKVSTTLQKLSDVKINYSYIQKSIDYRKTNLLVTKRLDLSSPGSTFIAFFSENEMVSPNTFYSVKCAPPHALVICLWINSVFGIIQFLNRRMETRGSYCDILKEDLIEFDVPSVKQLPDNLLKWYEENRETEFPTLAEQFTSKSPRRGLDRAMMLWMGWKESEVDTDLDALYVALHDELQLLKSAMKG